MALDKGIVPLLLKCN